MVESLSSRKKYEWYRHHAWAGLGLLSVFLAIRYFVFIPNIISLPVIFILVAYILIALLQTYRYSHALIAEKELPVDLEKEKLKFIAEKEKLKLEKKKIKAELKARKKANKK